MILKQALEKYGKENFEVVVLSTYDTEEDLNNAEIMFIETRNPNYNIAKGGTGGYTLARADEKYKQEVIAKRSKGLSNAWNNASEEKRKAWGENISKAKKGKIPNFGDYKQTKETKEKRRLSCIEASKNLPKSWYINHAKAMKARSGIPNVKCFKPVEVKGIIYNSVKEACEKIGISKPTLYKWIKNGKAKYVN
jgi:group I intron endonuclease